MRAIFLITALAIAVPVREDVTPKDAKPLQEQLQGSWQMIKAVVGGEPENGKKVDETVITFTGNQLQVREQGRQTPEEATFTIDATKRPASMDIQPTRDQGDKKVEAIFKIEGDMLTLCFARGGGGTRPTEFVSTSKTGVALLQLRRVKK